MMKKAINFILAVMAYLLFFAFVIYRTNNGAMDFGVYTPYWRLILSGWLITIVLSLTAVILALFVGLVVYLMAESRFSFLNYMAEIHKTIIYGTPLIAIVIIGYYYIGDAFNIDSKFWVGVLLLGLYIGAYVADIYKGAIDSIHINQWQAAKMFGFTRYQTYRYIVFPQVLRTILPPLAGQFALTIKGSALLSYMAMDEYMNVIKTIQAATYRYTEGYVYMAIGYLIVTIPLIRLLRRFETKASEGFKVQA